MKTTKNRLIRSYLQTIIFFKNLFKKNTSLKRKENNAENSNLEIKTEGENLSVYALITDKSDTNAGISVEEARALHKQYMKLINETEDSHSKMNYAANLITSGQYELCIKVCEKIMEKHPPERGDCELMIGAALYFLGKYLSAIEHYQYALKNGADPNMVADNIQEAEEALENSSP